MQYRYLLAGALATSVAASFNTTEAEPQTVTEVGATVHTVITITSCEDHKCNEQTVPATHSIVTKTIDSVETVYTTLCPIETGKEGQQPPAPGPESQAPAPPAPAPESESKPPAPGATTELVPPLPASKPPAPAPTSEAAPPAPAQESKPPAPAQESKPPAPAQESQPPAPAPPAQNQQSSKPPAPAAPTTQAGPSKPAPSQSNPTTLAGPEKSAPPAQGSSPSVPEVSGLANAGNLNQVGFTVGVIGLIAALL